MDTTALTTLHTQRQRRRWEPRASRLPSPRNVSAPASCAFYGVADAHFRCRYPRSCTDCLAMPGCMLLLNGSCVDADDSGRTYVDAAVAQAATHNGTWNFGLFLTDYAMFARNTSYCTDADATCASCRAVAASTARRTSESWRLSTMFCVGAGGCVCTGVCDVSSYRDTLVSQPGCAPPSRLPSLPRLPSFTSRARDPRAPMPRQIHAVNEPDTCALVKRDVRGCREPRGLAACLRKEDCAIDGGKCVDAAAMSGNTNHSMMLHNTNIVRFDAAARASLRVAASSTRPCDDNDHACDACVDDLYSGNLTAVRCIGAQGCLCRALLDEWSVGTATPTCIAWDGRAPNPVVTVIVVITVVLVGSLLFVLLAESESRRRAALRVHATDVLRYMLDHVPRGLDLDLFGWRRFQRALRHHEQRLLAGEEVLSPVVRPMELKDMVVPTAPAFEEMALSSAPTQHDPMALASAPIFRLQRRMTKSSTDKDDDHDHDHDDGDATGPSAPPLH